MQRKILSEWNLDDLVKRLNDSEVGDLMVDVLDLPVPLASQTEFFYCDGEKLYYAASPEDPEEWDDTGWR